MIHHATAKLGAAAILAGTASFMEFAQGEQAYVSTGGLITLLLAGAMSLIAALVASAWKDLRGRLNDMQTEHETLRARVNNLEIFRNRAMWACPLIDPNLGSAQQIAHLQAHLVRLQLDKPA